MKKNVYLKHQNDVLLCPPDVVLNIRHIRIKAILQADTKNTDFICKA